MPVRRPLLWILLTALTLSLVILVARHDDGTVGPLSTGDFASLIYKIGILVLIGGAVLTMFREGFAHALESALLWVVVALLLVLGYTYRYELRDIADRVMTELVPGRTASRGHTVELARSSKGEFSVTAQVNGHRLPMVFDTGASAVVLTHEAARAAGLPTEMMKYTVNVDTANGRAQAAAVTLDRVAVGSIVERSVPALVAQQGQLRTSLLGMSFLNRLQGWEVRGGKLMLRGYP